MSAVAEKCGCCEEALPVVTGLSLSVPYDRDLKRHVCPECNGRLAVVDAAMRAFGYAKCSDPRK